MTISVAAAKRLHEIFDAEGRRDLMLRVTVSGGGCSGFQYGFDFADGKIYDLIFERDGIKVVIDDILGLPGWF